MAYDIKEIGMPISCVLTTPSLTITDITDWSYEPATKVNYRKSGNEKHSRHYLTDLDEVLTIKTSDANIAFGSTPLKKGVAVAGLTFTAEAPSVGDAGGTSNSIGLQHTGVFAVTMSYAAVEECRKISGNATGAPAEYEIVFRTVRTPAGADATTTATITTP